MSNGTPGQKVEEKPPTDQKNDWLAPTRGDMERAQADAWRRRDEEREKLALELSGGKPRKPAVEPLYVKPKEGVRVAYLQGGFYPQEGTWVIPNDVYVARRLRDGSLVPASAPEPQQQPAPPPPEQQPAE